MNEEQNRPSYYASTDELVHQHRQTAERNTRKNPPEEASMAWSSVLTRDSVGSSLPGGPMVTAAIRQLERAVHGRRLDSEQRGALLALLAGPNGGLQ